ncbi:AAEL002242-PA [Aedes aegypti]|uniref:AAEL002242-PA n=1 Tax=Aedes aegypti TaxID=7159 RepID=Q17IZ9_AEDAE|nr:AAEL002242-PA [Aedes aegypti]
MFPTGKLVPIPRADWPQLRDLFKGNDLANEIPSNAIQNYIEWTSIDPKIRHLEILSLNDSWQQNGTFIISDRHELFFFSLEPSLSSLEEALELIDWDFPYRIYAILDQHQAVLKRVLNKLNVPYPRATVACNLYRLSKEIAIGLETTPPDGFRLGNLEPRHVKTINETWPFRSGGSEYALTRCIAWNTNVGLFNEKDELIAWCLLNNLGIICVLYTVEKYRRRGLAEVVLRSMVSQLAQRGMNSVTSVLLENVPSRTLFEKLGFEGNLTVHDSCHPVNRLVEWNFC